MSKLEDFLSIPDLSEVKKTITVKSVDGKAFELVIRPLTDYEHSEFQKRSQSITKKSVSFDAGKYNRLTIESCIVEPNFADAKFLDKVKCTSPYEFLSKKFPAGALTDIATEIQKLSGFESIDLEIEEAKN